MVECGDMNGYSGLMSPRFISKSIMGRDGCGGAGLARVELVSTRRKSKAS